MTVNPKNDGNTQCPNLALNRPVMHTPEPPTPPNVREDYVLKRLTRDWILNDLSRSLARAASLVALQIYWDGLGEVGVEVADFLLGERLSCNDYEHHVSKNNTSWVTGLYLQRLVPR